MEIVLLILTLKHAVKAASAGRQQQLNLRVCRLGAVRSQHGVTIPLIAQKHPTLASQRLTDYQLSENIMTSMKSFRPRAQMMASRLMTPSMFLAIIKILPGKAFTTLP